MNLALKLWKLATSKMETDAQPYIDKVRREAEKAAEKSNMRIEVQLPSKARKLKKEIGDALYEDGFNVITKDFPSTGTFYVIVDWKDTKPSKPDHIDYTGY
ncbi:hypothetical protein BCP8-2_083 [Bacillus phage BCP8-2]|uniref:Uncharacterized protein n=1 Tax=Bacillus phage BCP8-2 TaxID=1129192 RepID=A0A0E3D9E5_9CAUD|nr:hypothetical protein BCP8-2_083 [Bacillus phage BCP8-2]AHJ87121.1 hypothetical protein BCP8-2_083 [Bacillus phage BCP8-2]